MLENGVQNRITECDNVGESADPKVYLCVNDGVFFSNDAYNYSEESGSISRNAEYQGVNALFSLTLDKGKADRAAAEEYVRDLEKEWGESAEDEKDTSVLYH